MINWKTKLTSRKFWLALAGLFVGVLALFQVDANTTQQISGVIMSLGSVIAYIVGEGLVDTAAAGAGESLTLPADELGTIAGKTDAPIANAPQADAHPESGAVASDTTGAK